MVYSCKKDRKIPGQRDSEHSKLPRRDTPHLLKLQRGVTQIIITMPHDGREKINGCAF